MQRENYYIILELSIDPPENDPQVIEKAIQTKKIEWSRLRNHPTKGLQIQKFINMIPDIQYVMQDDMLREKEAQAAAEFIESSRETKISEVDSHIDILMGKGYIAQEDIIRLAEIHGLSQNDINARIIAKKDAKYAHVDQLISLRIGKGYLTEDEVLKIAKKNGMDADEIKKRIRCPIIKDEKEAEAISIRPLDKSIEKAINDNLQVVGKNSLYDFLGLPGTSDLKDLQEKAGKKKKSLAAVGKKDAVFTAGITLAGHCLTIFKNNDTRVAYDVSLAKAKLGALDSDINIAAINNKIRHEYFDALINKAMDYGMDREEASGYIRSFCQKKKYRIEQKPGKKKVYLIGAAVSAVAAILIIAGFLVFSKIHTQKVIESDYRQLIKTVDAQSETDQKIRLLKKYISTNAKTEYSADAQKRISQLELQVATKKFTGILQEAEQLLEAEKPEDALALLNEHLEKTKDPENKKSISQRIKHISELIESRDFEELKLIALTGDTDQKIEIFQKFIKNHPKSQNREQVQTLINEMSSEYFIYVRKMLAAYETSEKWEDAVRLCQNYIDIYDNSNSDLLKQLLPDYQEKIRNEKIYVSLTEKVEKLGNNYADAVQIFKDYLEAYPETSITGKIKNDIKRLNDLIAIQNINRATNALRIKFAASGGRFVENHPGVITDTQTGLMWCITDSDVTSSGTCLTYELGEKYVKSLITGGFKDWRLPTPAELAKIFKTSPAFPSSGKKSYWTSESYTGYSDGWQIQVATFSSEDSSHWEVVRKNALECGTALAVRNP